MTGARDAPRPSQSQQSHPLWLTQWLTRWVVPGAGVYPRRNMCQSLPISEARRKSRVSPPGFTNAAMGRGPRAAAFEGGKSADGNATLWRPRSLWIYLCSSGLFFGGGGVVVRGRLSRPWKKQFKSFLSVCKQFVSFQRKIPPQASWVNVYPQKDQNHRAASVVYLAHGNVFGCSFFFFLSLA